MSAHQSATLTVQSRAAKQLEKLDRAVRAKFVTFQAKFCQNLRQPGLNFEPLRSHPKLYSARVDHDYRAVLLHVGQSRYQLLSVMPHKDVYERLSERFTYLINDVTGGIEVIDFDEVNRTVTPSTVVLPQARRKESEVSPLFDGFDSEELTDLGVPEPLLPSIRAVHTDAQLIDLLPEIPEHAAQVLTELATGASVHEVMEKITDPVKPVGPIDTNDYVSAAQRPTTIATSADEAVAAMLADGFDNWRIFLHPTQRKLVDRDYKGPARVGGGPGTGKTVVALHRAARLARRLPEGSSDKILLTTFTKNLAADLADKLELLAEDVADRVEVVNIDKLTYAVAVEHASAKRNIVTRETQLIQWWTEILGDDAEFDADFCLAEWREVICGQSLVDCDQYFTARRTGRGHRLTRAQRAAFWQLSQRFDARLSKERVWTWDQVRMEAALAQEASPTPQVHRYAHIVVDEAQDMTAAHWRLLRALTERRSNDIFIAGDTYQRIYGRPLSLGPLGIEIRGRSSRLTLSYRTTREILATAIGVMQGVKVDDLDDGNDTLDGYRSVMSGARPHFAPQPNQTAELAAICDQVRSWRDAGATPGSIAVCTPNKQHMRKIITRLKRDGTEAAEITGEGPPAAAEVHVGTMHRLKGLEYQYVVVAGIGAANFPGDRVDNLDKDSVDYRQAELRARSLLFVATTRARDAVTLVWHGETSPLLAGVHA